VLVDEVCRARDAAVGQRLVLRPADTEREGLFWGGSAVASCARQENGVVFVGFRGAKISEKKSCIFVNN